ncbi:MAG TPA: N-acetylmuramoyl-L-alanine amidase [Motiliproteus sp.]
MLKRVTAIAMLMFSLQGWAASVDNVRLWLAPDHTRLVFDLSGPVEHNLFTLSGPERIVLDLEQSKIGFDLATLELEKSPVKAIRSGTRSGNALRIVLDLERKVQPRSFDLPPNDQYGHRLVLDLVSQAKPVEKTVADTAAKPQQRGREVVIAIDAGHGGEDPGAIGPGRVREKDVVLAIARELHGLLAAEPGFKPVLIREGDYYVSLRNRTRMARKEGADMFVSIHADAFKDKRARGASVWTLSDRGATSEMGRWLAGRENSTDLIGGVGSISLNDKDDVLAGVLLDMSMTAVIGDSTEIGGYVLRNLGQVARLHKKEVEKAGFVVLKSPDIPSILVETGFISNPTEAALLKSRSHQTKLARAVFGGIKQHFQRKPPALTWLALQKEERAARSYRVARGDTLSIIASRRGVSVQRLRELNGLKNDVIRVGQLLQIPAS